jgi:hypothetical protein
VRPDRWLGFQDCKLGFDESGHRGRRRGDQLGTLGSLSHDILNATLALAVELQLLATLPLTSGVSTFTRNGLDWTKRFSLIAGALDIPGQAIIDGEVV